MNYLIDYRPSNRRTALVIGHPGHELKVHGWLEAAQPLVFVMTDGSGRSGESRLRSTTATIERVGARPGCIYGQLTDNESYKMILNREFELFVQLTQELSDAFVREKIEYVAGDAAEGYNPMHDACRLVINSAVTIASRTANRPLGNLEISLVPPLTVHDKLHTDGICRTLDEVAFGQKMAAARRYSELAGEVDAALEQTAISELKVECMRPVGQDATYGFDQPPFYETYGEQQVAVGHYRDVIRYREHMLPLAETLQSYAESKRSNTRSVSSVV